MKQPSTNNNNQHASASAAAGLSIEGDGTTRVLSNITDLGRGKSVRIRNPQHRAKAERFWNTLTEQRKLPGHCCRCGRPHAGLFRQCDRCRERVANAKARRQAKELTLAHCVAMVRQCRREVTKLREIIKQRQRTERMTYSKGYARGLKTGREARKYHDAFPTISRQELAQINHAFDSEH